MSGAKMAVAVRSGGMEAAFSLPYAEQDNVKI
jgi:hypothetical protein